MKAKVKVGTSGHVNTLHRKCNQASKVTKNAVGNHAQRKNFGGKQGHRSITIPFSCDDKILLVGEGDFSFSTSIVEEGYVSSVVTSTCLDTETELRSKYPDVGLNVDRLVAGGNLVHFGVDATKLHLQKRKLLSGAQRGQQFTTIIFNFPHVGGSASGKSTDQNRQVRANQDLLVSFFQSASAVLERNGRILLTAFEGMPYTLWNVKDLARHCRLTPIQSIRFDPSAYPGYTHVKTMGCRGSDWDGGSRDARTFIFQKSGFTH